MINISFHFNFLDKSKNLTVYVKSQYFPDFHENLSDHYPSLWMFQTFFEVFQNLPSGLKSPMLSTIFPDCRKLSRQHCYHATKVLRPLPQLFNALPRSIRDTTKVSVEEFKEKLDRFLQKVPDGPNVDGLTPGACNQWTAAPSNSIVDQTRRVSSRRMGC